MSGRGRLLTSWDSRKMARTRDIVGGLVIAIAIAVAIVVPSIRGISTWKYLLAVVALVLFVLAEKRPKD